MRISHGYASLKCTQIRHAERPVHAPCESDVDMHQSELQDNFLIIFLPNRSVTNMRRKSPIIMRQKLSRKIC